MQSQQPNSAAPGESAGGRPLRTLLPATTPRSEPPPTQPKRARVTLACAACRTRKTKCNGERPQCSECAARDSQCQYKETETAQTKRKHQDLEELFELLKSLPYEDASETLARIRAGEEPRDIVETITHGNVLMQIATELGGSRPSADESPTKSRRGSASGVEDEEKTESESAGGGGAGTGAGGSGDTQELEPRTADVPTREKSR
ncbi:hypothetical protein PSV08DRAFT_351562 [Bipolaris maydis]|nr:hypothetical protein PSV08DRAFT_351562 [Bipolaris maydis]KAJ6278094.1 hypothetical protein J3E71DRAFT_364574 [Bipolaris maydis]